jgi:hypothetical protein
VHTELGRSQVEVQQCALSWEIGEGGGGRKGGRGREKLAEEKNNSDKI